MKNFKFMKKCMAFALTGVVVVSSLAGCGNKQSGSGEDSNVFKIGGIGPTTGDASIYGMAVKNAIELAANEINENGGMNGYQVEVQFEDDEHDAEKSVNAYNNLKDWGMKILVGTTTSAPCVAVSAESERDNLFQITPSGSSEACITPTNVFRVCFSDANQGKASAQYISDNLDVKKVAIIYDSSDVYSSGIYETFMAESKNSKYEVVSTEAFTSDSNKDFSTQIQKAKSAGADLVFLPIYYQQAALILDQANKVSYSPIFFGCDGIDGILSMANFNTELAEGVMLLTPFAADAKDDLTVNFVTKFQESYKDIPNQFAADAYDAMYAVKTAIEEAEITPDMSVSDISDKMQEAMVKINIKGLTGGESGISWSADGEPSKEPKAVVIKDGAYSSL